MGFSQAHESGYGISKCKFCANCRIITLLYRACHPFVPVTPQRLQRPKNKLDEQFLSYQNSRPEWRKLPFSSDLHHEISRSWKQPFFARLTNAAATDFTNLVGSVEQGYTAIPAIEDTLATLLSLSSVPSRKPRPLLPTNPCRTTPALIGPTWQLIRQAWPFILWPSSKPTRRIS